MRGAALRGMLMLSRQAAGVTLPPCTNLVQVPDSGCPLPFFPPGQVVGAVLRRRPPRKRSGWRVLLAALIQPFEAGAIKTELVDTLGTCRSARKAADADRTRSVPKPYIHRVKKP